MSTSMGTVHFGATLPQIKRSWQETRAAALEFEALGFDSLWLNDHLYGIPMPTIPILEAWTTLCGVGTYLTSGGLSRVCRALEGATSSVSASRMVTGTAGCRMAVRHSTIGWQVVVGLTVQNTLTWPRKTRQHESHETRTIFFVYFMYFVIFVV